MADRHKKAVTIIGWAITVLMPMIVLLLGIAYFGYWSVPPFKVHMEGDHLFAFDPEIGPVPRPNASFTWTDLGRGSLRWTVHTDRRGARVAKRGEQTPDKVDLLLVGDSFTWGHGVEGDETFAHHMAEALGVGTVNLGVPGYGTVHSLLTMRNHRRIAPKLIVFSYTPDHARRNVAPCGSSAYVFCLDYAHVTWDAAGALRIAHPQSDGVARVHRQFRAEREGLDPLTWIVHGVDIMLARWRAGASYRIATDMAKREAALDFLMGEMAATAKEMNATLLVVFLPAFTIQPPETLARSAALGYHFLDLNPPFADFVPQGAWKRLFIPKDGHPSPLLHKMMAREIVAYIREKNLL